MFRSPLERATPLFGGMAARGGAGETGGSQEDSDAEGDPSFDLMEIESCVDMTNCRVEDSVEHVEMHAGEDSPEPMACAT